MKFKFDNVLRSTAVVAGQELGPPTIRGQLYTWSYRVVNFWNGNKPHVSTRFLTSLPLYVRVDGIVRIIGVLI